jgi:H2-forming N5,N10-methylenetetrahydromethanopterin dehydrogenase-like enzyme
MSYFLMLNSADSSVKRVMVDQDLIESVFEFDGDVEQSNVEQLVEAMEKTVISWGNKAIKVLMKSTTKISIDLVAEFENIYDDFIDDMKENGDDIKKYTVVKCTSGNYYTVTETLDDIQHLMEENNYKERIGI